MIKRYKTAVKEKVGGNKGETLGGSEPVALAAGLYVSGRPEQDHGEAWGAESTSLETAFKTSRSSD
jgi:hypothetical protein